MVSATVRFLRTTDDFGQEEVARVTLDGPLEIDGAGRLADTMLEDVDRSDRDAVLEVMRLAPERFDGAYLRATFEEGVSEGGPGSGHHGHRGIPGSMGRTCGPHSRRA